MFNRLEWKTAKGVSGVNVVLLSRIFYVILKVFIILVTPK